jgi:hypothetical protein
MIQSRAIDNLEQATLGRVLQGTGLYLQRSVKQL